MRGGRQSSSDSTVLAVGDRGKDELHTVSGLDQKGRNTAEVERINMRSLDMATNNDFNGIYHD
jgi:hypothetical protein